MSDNMIQSYSKLMHSRFQPMVNKNCLITIMGQINVTDKLASEEYYFYK